MPTIQCCEAFVLLRIKSSLNEQNEAILENKTQKGKTNMD